MDIRTLFDQTVDRYPDRVALKTALQHDSLSLTFAQWNDRVNRVACAMSEYGVCPGDRVGFFLVNAEASVTSYFACQKIGAVPVPMNFRLKAGELAYILRDSGARMLVYSNHLAVRVREIEGQVKGLHDYIAVTGTGFEDIHDGHLDFNDIAANYPDNAEPLHQPAGGDLSALVYTSGTTGRPKGVMHTHENDVAIAMNCVMEYGLRHTDRALHIAPLYHVGGMQAFFMPHMMVGASNVLMGKYDAAHTLQTIADEKITTLFAVPAQIQEMLYHPDFGQADVSSLRLITTGGAAPRPSVMQQVLDKFCPNLFNGYGLTEASLPLLLHPEDVMAKLGSCGKPTLVTQARIVRLGEDGRGLRPDDMAERGEIGELIIRGPQVMKGYWNRPMDTQQKIQYGWCYSGDLFTRDADGFYFYQGRADDMIVSGGENIYPLEVENIISEMAGVRDVCVIGLPDAKWGEAVSAFIVRDGTTPDTPDAAAVDAYCKSHPDLADFKRPRAVYFIDALPRNPSGKVVRAGLQEIAASLTAEQKSCAG